MILSDTEQELMRQAQESHMTDRCKIYPFISWEKDSRGIGKKIFGTAFESICGLKMGLDSNKSRNQSDRYEIIEADAELRLPLEVNVKPKDEIEIIQRFGRESAGFRYEVTKFESAGVSGQRVLLKAVYI